MPCNHYRIVTRWNLDATAEEIAEIASAPEELVRWWPATFLRARRLDPHRKLGPGSEASWQVKGWLPYTMRFRSRIDDFGYPHHCRISVSGDFEGELRCQVHCAASGSSIQFDFNVKVNKPVVRYLSFLLKPLFCSNHIWVMVRGCQSMSAELARRKRGCTIRIPGPPPKDAARRFQPARVKPALLLQE